MSAESAADLSERISIVEQLERADCLAQWRKVFGRPPPKHLSVPFMRRVLVWELQCRLLSGVSARTERALARIASGKPAAAQARPGAHLVREWNGRTYQVEVLAGGYHMDGKTWRSLSAIARHITGAHWSGPRFFGLT